MNRIRGTPGFPWRFFCFKSRFSNFGRKAMFSRRKPARAQSSVEKLERKPNVPPLRIDRQGRAVRQSRQPLQSQTRTRFLPNLVNVSLISDSLKRSVRLRIAAAPCARSNTAAASTRSCSRPATPNCRPAPSS